MIDVNSFLTHPDPPFSSSKTVVPRTERSFPIGLSLLLGQPADWWSGERQIRQRRLSRVTNLNPSTAITIIQDLRATLPRGFRFRQISISVSHKSQCNGNEVAAVSTKPGPARATEPIRAQARPTSSPIHQTLWSSSLVQTRSIHRPRSCRAPRSTN